MEQIKQRFSKNSPRSSFLNDRQEDVQESFLAEDSDAFTGFRKSKNDADDTESDITLRLKLSDSADNFTADQLKTESLENGNINCYQYQHDTFIVSLNVKYVCLVQLA